MADDITIPSGGKFAPHPITTCAGRCVDVIDPGPEVVVYKNKETGKDDPPRLVPKIAFVFQSGKVNPENGRLYEVSVKFSQSMADNANLRKFLVSWFGGYDAIPEGAKKGKPGVLVGAPALITVANKQSRKGNSYATIPSICPIPEGMVAPTLPPYTRAPYWAEQKAEAQKVADQFLKQDTAEAQKYAKPVPEHLAADFDQMPPAPDGSDSDLPF